MHLVSQPFVTLVGKVDTVHFLVHNKVKRFNSLGHTAVVVLHIDFLCLEHTGFDTSFREELNERIVLRQSLVAAEQGKETFFFLFLVTRLDELFGFGQILCGQFALHLNKVLYQRLVLLKQLVIALGHRA